MHDDIRERPWTVQHRGIGVGRPLNFLALGLDHALDHDTDHDTDPQPFGRTRSE